MKQFASMAAIAIAVSMLSACGPEPVPTDVVDQNQGITRENAQLNALRFKGAMFPNADQVVMQSDSTVTPACRFGDGWASGLVIQGGRTIENIKCQTNGNGKGLFGCLTKKDFESKDYASADGRCDTSLTKLEKFK